MKTSMSVGERVGEAEAAVEPGEKVVDRDEEERQREYRMLARKFWLFRASRSALARFASMSSRMASCSDKREVSSSPCRRSLPT